MDMLLLSYIQPQVRQFEVPGEACDFRGHAFHQIAVTTHNVNVVVEHRKAWLVVARSKPTLCNRHAYRIGRSPDPTAPLSFRPLSYAGILGVPACAMPFAGTA